MGQAIGQVIAFAVGVALGPTAIIGVVLILAGPRGRSGGLACCSAGCSASQSSGRSCCSRPAARKPACEGAPATWSAWSRSCSACCCCSSPCAGGAGARAARPTRSSRLDGGDRLVHRAQGGCRRDDARGRQPQEPPASRWVPRPRSRRPAQAPALRRSRSPCTSCWDRSASACRCDLPADGRSRRRRARQASRMDGRRERDDHGRHLPDHRRQADRRCDQRVGGLNGMAEGLSSA